MSGKMLAAKRMRKKPIEENDVERIFSKDQIEELARLVPKGADVDLKQLRKLIHGDARAFAQASRVPDNNKRRKQIAELEEAGRTKDIQWVSGSSISSARQ
jgi:hypothetical protein